MGDRVARGLALLADEPGATLAQRRRSLLRRLHPDLRGDDSGRDDLEAVIAATAPQVPIERPEVEVGGLGIRVTWGR